MPEPYKVYCDFKNGFNNLYYFYGNYNNIVIN